MSVFRVQDYIHPLDRAALDNLEQIPGLRKLADIYLKTYQERMVRQMYMSQMVRLGPRQLPYVYRLLPPICEAYGIDEPELYLTDGSANAWTFGQTRVSIVINNGIIESLDPLEIQAVLAHECAHILSEHVLFRTMADRLERMAGQSKAAALMVAAVQPKLMDWYRKSELSADRAAIAFIGDPQVWLRVLLRFAGVMRTSSPDEYSIEEFIQQSAEFDEMLESKWEKFIQFRSGNSGGTHPLIAVRAREAQLWGKSRAFAALAAVAAPIRAAPRCQRCGFAMNDSQNFCVRCGAEDAKGNNHVGIPQ